MIDSIYLAWRYVAFYSLKTLTLIISISLIAFLPIALQTILQESEKQLKTRAETTPIIVGAKGNVLDLAMNTLYFTNKIPEFISMAASDKIINSGLAISIPMFVKYKAQGFPVVGTTIDYFKFRQLEMAEGRFFALLGEAVIGAKTASKLGIKVGEEIVSTPENLFNLAGVYPLKMKVVGILKKNNTADNNAIFVDVKTTWVIQGLGHGHKNVNEITNINKFSKRSRNVVTFNKTIKEYNEINAQNLESFHFHGDVSSYSISAIIAQPFSQKSAVILRGRYLADNAGLQVIKPSEVISNLMETIFNVKQYVDVIVLIVSFATVLAVFLIFSLSIRLRQREIETIYHLGCGRFTVTRLVLAEIMIISIASALICFASYLLLQHYLIDIVKFLFIF